MNSLSHWFRLIGHAINVSRPLFWLNTAIPVIWAIMLQGRQFTWPEFWLWFSSLFIFNWFMHSVNDYYDYETDLANPRKGGIEGALTPKPVLYEFTRWSVVLMLGATALISPAWDWYARGLWLIFLLLVWFYSAKPLRFKGRLFLDGLSNIMYAGSFFFAWWPARGEISDLQPFILGTIIFSLWSIAANWLTSVVDLVEDEAAGVKTTAVRLGQTRIVRLSWLIFLSALIVAVFAGWYLLAIALAFYVLLCYRASNAKPEALRKMYQWFWSGNIALGVGISFAILLSQPDWTYWYYGGYFVGTVTLTVLGLFWANWPKIYQKYLAPLPTDSTDIT